MDRNVICISTKRNTVALPLSYFPHVADREGLEPPRRMAPVSILIFNNRNGFCNVASGKKLPERLPISPSASFLKVGGK